MKLAEDKAVDAIPAIQQALAVEKVPRDQVNIALALGLLGDTAGSAELKKVCADENFVPELRLYAVQYMFDLHFSKDEDCLSATLEIVRSKSTKVGDRVSALGLLPRFQNLTTEESQKISQLVLNCLKDSEPVVRMAASQSLASLGNAAVIPYLEAAIEKEEDENVRTEFEADLKQLKANGKE
jgi:HEAT repeat protein